MADTKDMVVRIVSVDTDATIEKKDGGTYQGAEVIYKTADGKTNTKGMHSNTFKYNKTLLTQLQELEKGDYVKVVTEKQGDFVNWKSVERTERPADAGQAKTAPSSVAAQESEYTKMVTGTYVDQRETREERAARQVMIVRQSSLSTAVALLAQDKDYVPSASDVIAVAQEFEAYVLGTAAPFKAEQLGEDEVAQPD